MLFSSQLPLSGLIDLCRALRHYLGAGLTLRDVFEQQSRRGAPSVRPVAARISVGLEGGEDLESALKREKPRFPPLFVSLATVGEQTGMLPEVCRELERYFALQIQLRRQFLAQIAWPIFQLIAAIFIISALIWILGAVAEMNPGSVGLDPFGLGTGAGPALAFLFGAFGTLAAVVGLYWLGRRVLREGVVDGVLLKIPVIGPCMEALALTRFCLALRLTLESGMSIIKAIRLSLEATGNGAFTAAVPVAQDALRSGDELAVAVARTHLFPQEFRHVLAVGEESGRLTDVLEQQGDQYQEAAERRLRRLAIVAGGLVWFIVAVLIIIAIFRIFLTYLDMLDPARYGL